MVQEQADRLTAVDCPAVGLQVSQRIEDRLTQELGILVPVIDPSKAAGMLAEVQSRHLLTHGGRAYPAGR